MGSPAKTQVENGLRKLFNFRSQTIDVSDQAVFVLKDSVIHDEEEKKNKCKWPAHNSPEEVRLFFSFMMTVHPDQADTNCNYSRMTCRNCVKIPLDVDRINASIDTKMLKKPHDVLVHLAALYNGRKLDIGTLKKDRGDIFSECCAESFKAKFLHYINEVLFEMVKTALKDIYLGGTTPTELQNEVYTCCQMYYDRDTRGMVNQSVNEFYTRFLFNIDALPQDVAFPLDINATLFNNVSTNVIELLISEGVQVPPRLPAENHHQGNQRLLLVRNSAVEAEKNSTTIKAAVQT